MQPVCDVMKQLCLRCHETVHLELTPQACATELEGRQGRGSQKPRSALRAAAQGGQRGRVNLIAKSCLVTGPVRFAGGGGKADGILFSRQSAQ